ncbi:pickpocket protein 28-like [Anoplophora glabripennis]|uniref:pickpocket protein 28-like n=1 Tax=Anoplophora glabripennis TaxID=217634 RepID=UPI0008750407|nr:pickpocket protein 28-like [Anoplophora glabripennis]
MTDSTFVNFDGTIPLQEVEHPGVAICNINKISKKRAYEFAKKLSPLIKENNITAIMEDIKLIGNLYNFNNYGEERFEKVQEMLDKYDGEINFYDPTGQIIELTTPCEEILQKCRWNSQNYPCEDIFLTRMTFDGVCCVFNYIRPSERASLYINQNRHAVPSEPEVSHGSGMQYGLEVVLNNDVDDYFYPTLETTGFKVHFFHCKDFPDVLSGSLKEYLVDVGKRILFNIEVDVIRSTPQIKSIPIHSRKCMFDSEANTSFGAYRQSDCFVECKMRSMQALCNCVPFVMPIEPESSKFCSVCTLTDIPCGKQYFRT